MQLISGRVAQEYNNRKSRTGAFWQSRYFATAVSTDQHLVQCLVYIDLNMVRAGVVTHPSRWNLSGYCEIQRPPCRYRIIDFDTWCELLGLHSYTELSNQHRSWVEDALACENRSRDPKWTESIAVGTKSFKSRF